MFELGETYDERTNDPAAATRKPAHRADRCADGHRRRPPRQLDGTEALRVAGIEAALRRLGCAIEDRGNIAGLVNPTRLRSTATGTSRKRRSGVKPSATRSMMRCEVGRRSCSAAITLSRSGRSAVARHCAAMQRPLCPLAGRPRRLQHPDTSPPATFTACRSPLLLVMVPGA